MPRAGADKFGSARAAVKPRCFRGMRPEHRKNRTRIGPHLAQPWAAERPVISVLEFGYVRRSEPTNVQKVAGPAKRVAAGSIFVMLFGQLREFTPILGDELQLRLDL